MNVITMTIHNIKGIHNGTIELPLENGIYALVGSNGCGKSTVMSCLAQLISRHNLGLLMKEDYDSSSYVEFRFNNKTDRWTCNDKGFWKSSIYPKTFSVNGTYEGSLFYGQRFRDSKNVDYLMEENQIEEEYIVDADVYIIEKLGLILHGNPNYYDKLKRIKNKRIAEQYNLKNTPYFFTSSRGLISQYRMSSGECLLISLLHFIYNSLIRRSLPSDKSILMLIDEIELALHPVAINNLLDLLKELTYEYENLTVIITSHSPEVIRKISPMNIYKIEKSTSTDNDFQIINPCYPSYAIRDVYTHDGYDYLLLVEDELAKRIVNKSIKDIGLNKSRLINITPVGGWRNVLKLQYELVNQNILGVGKQVFSILDGDVSKDIPREFRSARKLFLPINSVEKYLKNILVDDPNFQIKKEINDEFFSIKSIDTIISEYNIEEDKNKKNMGSKYKDDSDGKRLYKRLIKDVEKRNITEMQFIDGIYEIIKKYVDLTSFNKSLEKELSL